jgi:uncharacterized protein (DUF2235 family)
MGAAVRGDEKKRTSLQNSHPRRIVEKDKKYKSHCEELFDNASAGSAQGSGQALRRGNLQVLRAAVTNLRFII